MKIKIVFLLVMLFIFNNDIFAKAAVLNTIPSHTTTTAPTSASTDSFNQALSAESNSTVPVPTGTTQCAALNGVCSTLGGNGCPPGTNPLGITCGGGEACCSKPPTGKITNPVNAVNPVNTTPTAPVGGTTFVNPLQFDTVEGFLGHFLTVLQQIIVTLSLVFIVIGAIMYIVSAGNSGMMEKAKGAITASLIGLTLGIAAPSFLKEISLVLGWTGATSAEVEAALTLTQISLKVLNFLLSAVGILAILMLILGGTMYLSSAGNEDRIDMGKKITKNAIFGIIIAFSAMVLVRQIALFFAQ